MKVARLLLVKTIEEAEREPVMVIPLSEHFKTGPESMFCSNKINWDRPEYLRSRSILYNYLHRPENTT